jgi:hypothetical protein
MDEETKEYLKKWRSVFIAVNADLAKLLSPRIEKLLIENINNLRNLAIIGGAIATLALFLLTNQSFQHKDFVIVSVVGLLINIVFINWYLNKTVTEGINALDKKLEEESLLAINGQSLINDYLDGKISEDIFKKDFQSIHAEIEKNKIRPRETKKSKKDYAPVLLNILFALSILILICGILSEMNLMSVFLQIKLLIIKK